MVEREGPGSWLADVLPRYAALQLAMADDVDALLALGVPTAARDPPEHYEQLLDQVGAERRFREAAAAVVDLCDQLASSVIAETVQHDDLHDGQVFVRDGRFQVLDWGDACVSHPFFTLSVTLEGVLPWGLDDVENSVDIAPFRDEYLAPFARRTPGRPRRGGRAGPAARLGLPGGQRPVPGQEHDDDPPADVPRPDALKPPASGTFDSSARPAHALAWERVEGGSDGRFHAQHRCVRAGDGGGRPAAVHRRHDRDARPLARLGRPRRPPRAGLTADADVPAAVVATMPPAPPRWVYDPDFDLRYHLRRVIAPPPARSRRSWRWRGAAMSEFDHARPMWTVTLVEGLNDGGPRSW